MTDTPPPDEQASAAHTVALLNGEADGLRLELARLRQDLVLAHHAFGGPRGAQLLEANEQLVMAAMGAQQVEDTAERARREQVKFLATVAHELRNPLAPILTAAKMLPRASTDAVLMARLQQIIERQVGHLSRLVEDLLDATRATTGKFRLELGRVELTEVLSLAVDTCRQAIDTRGQQLTLDAPDTRLPVHGDPVRLTQIFSNLLDNASKYTPAGGRIGLHVTVTPGSTPCLTVTVSDNGIGITPQALPHIFDLFVQEVRGLPHSNRGLGIGLAVVRELVEAHGGTVVAHSVGTDQGTEVVVTLPMMPGA